MTTPRLLALVPSSAAVLLSVVCANAAITSVTQVGSNLDPIAPQIQTTPLADESFAFVDRTHELTAARYDSATGLLNTDATKTLAPFPTYLLGLDYVCNANDNRTAGETNDFTSYRVTYTVDQKSVAYLMLDNRLDGTLSNVSHANTSDPDLGGTLSWVKYGGWKRLNTGFMPNGQADYIGIDEGGTVAGPDARTHHDPGSGIGLNQFYAIYYKEVTGSFETYSIRQSTGSGNMYVVAVAPVPEPTTWVLLGFGLTAVLAGVRRRQS
jgi:hypothetical protein